MTHQFDDFDAQVQADESRNCEYYDEYREIMEAEEIEAEWQELAAYDVEEDDDFMSEEEWNARLDNAFGNIDLGGEA